MSFNSIPVEKVRVYSRCQQIIEEKIQSLQRQLDSFQSAANNETKSSAGDKYETGRAMMQLEKDKVAQQMTEVLKLRKVLDGINPQKKHDQVQLGSLVQTDKGYYFISVSLGKIDVDGDAVFCLSPVAPFGKRIIGEKAKGNFDFNGQGFHILSVS